MTARVIRVNETEWWDRIAMAVDRLAALPGARRRPVQAPGVEAHVYDDVKDVEALRRLTQMPDETPLHMLTAPAAVYCAELPAFVAVNDPETPLETHLARLKENP